MTSPIAPAKVRVARPTHDLAPLRRFYVDGLGLSFLGEFHGHRGYDGLILGTLDGALEVEFTRDEAGHPCPAPSRDNLLVLYVEDRAALDATAARFSALGVSPVSAENPYWDEKGQTFEDPEGWRVVVVDKEML